MKIIYHILISVICMSIISCSSDYNYNYASVIVPLEKVLDNEGNEIYETSADFSLLNTVASNHPLEKQLIQNLMNIENHSIKMRKRVKHICIYFTDIDRIEAYLKLTCYGEDGKKYYYFNLSRKAFYIYDQYGIKNDELLNIEPFLTQKQKSTLKNMIPEWRK